MMRTPNDMLLGPGVMLKSVEHVAMAEEQGLSWRCLMLPCGLLEEEGMSKAMRAAGIKVVLAPPHPSTGVRSLGVVLPLIFGPMKSGGKEQCTVE
jgi:hypothetical protein